MARRPRSLAGTHLFRDARTEILVWRRVDPKSGRRLKRSTGTKVLEIALRKAAEFEDEFERAKAGLTTYDCWRKELRPLADEFLAQQAAELCAAFFPQKRMRLLRALDALGLKTAADLDNVAALHDRLMALEQSGVARVSLRRTYQDPLRQFSAWLAANRRHLERDPLATWTPLRTDKSPKIRRALLPDEVARAFLACDRLDAIHRRKHPTRPIFLGLLVTAARTGALASRSVEHLEVKARRVRLGADAGKKRKGAAALDGKTLAELEVYVGERREGPLYLSPEGVAFTLRRLLVYWREAFSLGLVDALWPADARRALDLAQLVNVTLLSGRAQVSRGGNPKRIRPETIERRNKLEAEVLALTERLRPEWTRRMQQVDVYALRMTHRTWASLRGVPAVLIDKQLGHSDASSAGANEFVRLLVGSDTGRKHYLDVQDDGLFDASRSAKAVREFLDEALAKVLAGPTLLAPMSQTAPTCPEAVAPTLAPTSQNQPS